MIGKPEVNVTEVTFELLGFHSFLAWCWAKVKLAWKPFMLLARVLDCIKDPPRDLDFHCSLYRWTLCEAQVTAFGNFLTRSLL